MDAVSSEVPDDEEQEPPHPPRTLSSSSSAGHSAPAEATLLTSAVSVPDKLSAAFLTLL